MSISSSTVAAYYLMAQKVAGCQWALCASQGQVWEDEMDYNAHLKGKVFIVTAAGEAGWAKAACCVARGASVALAARDHAACVALVRDLGTRTVAIDADVGSAAGWLKVVRTTLDLFGRIDGVFDDGSIHDPSREEDERADGQADDYRLDDIVLV
jgi:hypothetical protein